MNKINRILLEYVYTDDLMGPALTSVSILSSIFLMVTILFLHKVKSKRLIINAFSSINYVLLLLLTFFSQTMLGMMMMASIAVFLFVYMQVLISHLLSVCSNNTKLLYFLHPIMYTVYIAGNLIKVFVVDRNSDTFQSLVFVMLIIQGLGFLFISGVNIKKLRQICVNYSERHNAKKDNQNPEISK